MYIGILSYSETAKATYDYNKSMGKRFIQVKCHLLTNVIVYKEHLEYSNCSVQSAQAVYL